MKNLVILIAFMSFIFWASASPVCQTTTDTITQAICSGETFYIGTTPYTQTGNYVETITNAGGCDSVVTLNLTVNPLPVSSFTLSNSPVCTNVTDTLTFTGNAVNTASYHFGFDQYADVVSGGGRTGTLCGILVFCRPALYIC